MGWHWGLSVSLAAFLTATLPMERKTDPCCMCGVDAPCALRCLPAGRPCNGTCMQRLRRGAGRRVQATVAKPDPPALLLPHCVGHHCDPLRHGHRACRQV